MKPATKADQNLVVSIVCESFTDNPSVQRVINPKKPRALEALAHYAFQSSLPADGVWLSNDNSSIAICYPFYHKKESLKEVFAQMKLIKNCIGFSRLLKVEKSNAYVNAVRPKDGLFLYFWFFGASENGKKSRAAFELKNDILKWSEESRLPIYLETSVARNRRVYERYGFEVYHTWERDANDTLWFMRRFPPNNTPT